MLLHGSPHGNNHHVETGERFGIHVPQSDSRSGGLTWDAYFWIDDADALLAEYQAKGVKIVRPICDQEYFMREFDIEDCNGFRLCFGHDISG